MMSDEILVNASLLETRVAIIENTTLQEVFIEREKRRGIVGNIYRGKVVRVLPGMQAAFIDIGLARACFIQAADFEKKDDRAVSKTINSLVREGELINVQVIKDPVASKGARVTALLSIPSRYLVYMSELDNMGVSQRIGNDVERTRLKNLVTTMRQEHFSDINGDFIVRTAAEGVGENEIREDLRFLNKLWQSISDAARSSQVPAIIYEDLPIYHRVLRDIVTARVKKIRVDSKETLQRMSKFAEAFCPEAAPLLEWYSSERPIFDMYGIEDDIHKALCRKVALQSGGYLIFDQTEAMTTIDVNTGGFVGCKNLEETIVKTNLEAAAVLARQIRVRNLGGIIIVDFIDMKEPRHQAQILSTLENHLAQDLTKTSISGVTELGLVQIVRKRTRETLEQIVSETCSSCQGRGTMKSLETVCYEIFRVILGESRAYNHSGYLVLASQSVIDRLLNEESANVAELESFIGKSIQFQVEPAHNQEYFDVIPL